MQVNYYWNLVRLNNDRQPKITWLEAMTGARAIEVDQWRKGAMPSIEHNEKLKSLCCRYLKGEISFLSTGQLKERVCLKCQTKFKSIGMQNRICDRCKKCNDQVYGGAICSPAQGQEIATEYQLSEFELDIQSI